MSINVTVVGSTGVSTSIASSDQIVVAVGGTLANTPLTALQVTAGANITITTTSGVYTFIGPNVPVQSVNGQTGTVVLNLANLTAAAASHTHLMSDITDLAYPVNVVNGQTGTVLLTSTDVSAASAVHTHVASDITNLTSVANVVSVNGQTGVAVLNSTNVSAASAVHTHVMADVTDLAFPVSSINGYTGTVSLTITDLTAAAASHTHAASEVTDLTSVANVVSVNGITGTPSIVGGVGVTVSTSGSSITIEAATGGTASGASLSDALPQALGSPTAGISGLASRADHVHAMPSAADVGAAAASHTHAASEVTDLTSVANVVSVNGQTGVVALTATDLTAAAASHTHAASEVTDLTSVANVVSVNGQTGVVTVTGGVTAASVTTKSLTVDENDYDAGSSDIVRLTPSANVTLTGLANGSDGVVRVLYNVGTHVVTLATGNTNSVETNRFSIVSGNVTLDEGDSASAWYDGTSQRWRVLEDQPAADGSGVASINGISGTPSIVAGTNVTVTTAASSITIAAPAPGDALPSQGGNGDRVLGTDGTSALWLTRYSVVEPVLVAGTGITFTKSSQAGSITIATAGTQLGDAPITPVFGLTGSSITLTVVPNGRFYIVEVFNAAQGKYVLYGQATSTAVSGTVLISGTEYNQANHYRFRALNADSVPSPWGYTDGAPDPAGTPGGGSGGGIAMSYLFG